MSKFRVFGEKWHLLTEGHFDKLEVKTVEGLFVWYDNHSSIYPVYTNTCRVKTSHNVHFPARSTEMINALEEPILLSGNSPRASVAALNIEYRTHAQALRGLDRDVWKSSMLDEWSNFERLNS